MVKIQFMGNLAADAQISVSNGREWITFRVADSRKWLDSNGVEHEVTQWASCIMPNTNGNLISYLKKGIKVFVDGDSEIDIYSSPKLKRMVGRYDISVRSVELCGGLIETVPRKVVTSDGLLVDTYKAYYLDANKYKEYCGQQVYGVREGVFQVDKNGFIFPIESGNEEQKPNDNKAQEQNEKKQP